MKSAVPKQFLPLGDKSILEMSVTALGAHDRIEGVCIGVSQSYLDDAALNDLHPKVIGTYLGGATRTETVAKGLDYLLQRGSSPDDWILVHDSNRPLLALSDVDALISAVELTRDGGILCQPIYDTVKYSESDRISKTLSRSHLYRAQTPQMFTIGSLSQALRAALRSGAEITDESQAIEKFAGLSPLLIPGQASNIKITTPEDLEIAKLFIKLAMQQAAPERES